MPFGAEKSELKLRDVFITGVALFLTAGGASASDPEREARLVEEMKANLFDGELIYLSDGERDFAAVLIEVEDAKGSVVLLHGRDFHADWPDVVGPVRVALAEAGWATLSAQMPVLRERKKYYDYVPLFPESYKRIAAAVEYMRKSVDGPLVLLAHSCGAHMAMNWIHEVGDSRIDAYVGVGMGATDHGQDLIRPFPIKEMVVPVLDILGTEEYPRVLQLAEERKKILSESGNPQSAQVFVEGADHFFKDRNRELAAAVIEWLDGLEFQSR
jgi:predicted alpha/beta-hydrolase family hydrolase